MNEENHEYPLVAYSPIPKGIVKLEPEEPHYGEDEEEYDREGQLLMIAYPPLPHCVVKEEEGPQFGDDDAGQPNDEFNCKIQVGN